MSDKVTNLRDANEQPDTDTVETLREALDMAERGELRSIALAGSLRGHQTLTSYATRDLQEAIGLVGLLHHTLCAKQRETRE